ncbi:FKBP-type peptidyl-prolyl cis-trans isomerase [Candidatus Obscuribacterales bacterium]|nr:FKBP-type peptidyl-prolyl cis-trans isomerase [Candidatus Obscuribacterales bacterium]MBX3136733.1 FKBP-type peptidyl-prolyl cis-trans isomerase [Candidatus Obscuribacterales bacterium]MBX3148558.1 FKBP-type peptidyl-prolyl cis-trans isomerase [Candidatus Obscuribacterales bacterium]
MKSLKLLLVASLLFGTAALPAVAKKEFTKGDSKKSELGAKTVKLPCGVEYSEDRPGTGAAAQFGNVAWIDFVGYVMPEGKQFDSTKLRGKPQCITVGAGSLCKGVDEGIIGMKVGAKRTMLVPGPLGFPKGSTASPLLTPGVPLKYEIELVHIGYKLPKKPEAPAATSATKGKDAKTPVKDTKGSAKPI